MKTFCIMTPTIPGREFLLERAMESVRRQTFGDYVHLVYGDGPTPKARELCSQARYANAEYREMSERGGGWGYKPRNKALADTPDMARYWLWLDDDNYLFEDCLETLYGRLGKAVLIYDILYYSSIWEQWLVLPPTRNVEANRPERSKIDMGNFAVRWDVARQVQFNDKVGNDFDYVDACCKVANYDIEWLIEKPLLVYGFAPFGRARDGKIEASYTKFCP